MKTESAYSFLLSFMLAFYFLGTSSWSHADESPIGPEFSSHIKSIVDNTSNFDAEIKLNFSDLGNGKINNGKPFYLTKDSIPGMILWLDANNSATISKAQGSKVYRGNQVTAYQNLVAYWTFEEGEGTSTADVSGNGNDAKFFGNPTFTADNAGKFGRAIDFDHNGDYLKVSHFAGVTTSNFVSASAWVKLDTLGTGNVNDSAIIGSASNDAHTFLLWYNYDGTETSPSYSFNVGNTSNLSNRVNSSANSVVANTWQHVVGTYNMGTKKIYVNGVLKGTTTNSTTQISPVGQDFYIGAWDGVTSEMRMDGFVDDLRVYNIELSQAQVTAIYGNGSGDIGSAVTPGPLVVTAPANTDRVLFWGDLSNEENHARITNVRTSGREPHYKTNAQNGLPAIQFADDYLAMSNGDSASFDGLETYTFMVVAKGNSNREDWMPILSKRGDGGMGWQFRTCGGDTRMTMTSRGTTGTNDPSGNGAYQVNMRGQWHFWTVRYDGLKKLQRGDGRTEYNVDDTGAIAPAPDRYMTLGARHDSGTSFAQRGNWEIGEVLFFDRAVSDDEMYMLENHLQSKWNIPFLDVAHPRAGKTPDFSGSAVGADVSIYWGLSDGGENKAAWDNVARIGNIFRKDTTANAIELRGYDSFREENYFDLGRSDKGYLGVAASGVSVLTNGPGNRGFDFNSDSDFMNAGIGITNGDQFADMGIGYFTAQEAGAHTFGYTHSDDRALFCLDLDQDGNFEWNGDKGQEILCTRNWSTWAITAFPGDYHYSTNQRTVTLSPGDYKFVVMHIEYGEGSGVEFRFGTPSVAFPTVIKPTDSAQAGMWSIQKLSNGNDIETQLNRVAQLNNLPKDKTFYFRAHASNSHGEDWADETASFVTENKLDFNYGKITFDTTNGTWSHTSGRSGVGTIVTENWTSPTGDTLGFKKTKYTFDSIKLSGNLEVEAYGQYPLSLNTVNNGDIEILVDINASGGAGTGVEARNSGNRDNFVTGGNAPGGKGVLGAGSGGDSIKQNGQGRPGGEPTNLVTTTVNGGGGYSNTAWEIEISGGGGSYAGQATVGSNNRGEVAGKTYGDRKLTALIGGSGGSGASGWWDGGQQRERGAGAGGAGGGAIEFVADGNGSIVIGTGVKILADGGDIPDTNYANETDNWRGGNGGGGSGGAIRLSAKNITNNGYLSATGGDRYHPTYGGAGGGGRIAMIARSSLKAGMYDVSGGGDGNELIIAENGSVYLEVNSFPLTYSTDLNTSVDLEMIWVEPGTFTMGSPENELYRDTSETEHNVTLTRGFYLGKYEVTQAQYEAVMKGHSDANATPSRWSGNPNRPVEKISWNDIHLFLELLNEKKAENIPSGWEYILPTEAQWEYACRAGTSTAYSWGDTISASDANWNHGNDTNQTQNVGQYNANPWGFFDMHGNVWEWTNDWKGSYSENNVTDPKGPDMGSEKIVRGGSYASHSPYIRSARRYAYETNATYSGIGFRLTLFNINHAPSFHEKNATFSIQENQTTIGNIFATDTNPHGDQITFSINAGADASLLEINASSGELSFQNSPDFERLQDANGDNIFEVVVRATDSYGLFSDQNIEITLTDVNEPPTFGGSDTLTLSESNTPISITPTWDRTFGGSAEDKLANTIKTSDGGYLLAGTSESNASGEKSQDSRGGRDYWVVKLDATGNKVWDRTYGGSAEDLCYGSVEVSGGGYLIWGTSYSSVDGDRTVENKGYSDYWIVRIDAEGNKLWDKVLGGESHDLCKHIIETDDGGFLIGGTSKSSSGDVSESGRGYEDFWVVKIDANGIKLWDKRFGGGDWDSFGRMSPTSDGGYLLAGSSQSNTSGDKSENKKGRSDYWVVRIDANGSKLWDKTYGGIGDDWFGGLTQANEEGFLVTGHSDSNATGDKSESSEGRWSIWSVRIDANGSKIWDDTLLTNNSSYNRDVISTNDRNFILLSSAAGVGVSGGDRSQPIIGQLDFWAVKIDGKKNKIWDINLGGVGHDESKSVVVSADGGYVFSGYSWSNTSTDKSEDVRGNYDYWIVKTDAEGNRNHHATDPDGDTLAWSISGGADAAKFTINAANGELTFLSADYENPLDDDQNNTYEVSLRATDSGGLYDQQTIRIMVEDVYEPSRENYIVELNSSVRLEMVWVDPGTFTMGSPETEEGRRDEVSGHHNEPEHNVTLSKGFFLGKFEVTQAQYEAVIKGNTDGLDANPVSSAFKDPEKPIVQVSYEDVQVFLRYLNNSHLDLVSAGWEFSLPSESEWEYACRAGTNTAYSWGNELTPSRANYNWDGEWDTGIDFRLRTVGNYAPNRWGLFDMHGNVSEWVMGWYGVYPDGNITDPDFEDIDSEHYVRGGDWYSDTLRAARRGTYATNQGDRNYFVGFRLALRKVSPSKNILDSQDRLIVSSGAEIGTVVTQFESNDLDGENLTYSLVSEAGDSENPFFQLDESGILKTNDVLDYETDQLRQSIRVRATDDKGRFIEKTIIVYLVPAVASMPVNITVVPKTIRQIRGISELRREAYFSICDAGTKFDQRVKSQERYDYLVKELGITPGRRLGVVEPLIRWDNAVREDTARPGFADIEYLKQVLKDKGVPEEPGEAFKIDFGGQLDIAAHGHKSAFPEFMGKSFSHYSGEDDFYPQNINAAAELSAHALKWKFNDFDRPAYYEPMNEPHWSFWEEPLFHQWHTKTHQAVKALGLDVAVGGPCLSVAYYYRSHYNAFKGLKSFIDGTNAELDFYSFHAYDFLREGNGAFDGGEDPSNPGRITSGMPLESILDLVSNYTTNTYGKEVDIVLSEHGAYGADELAEELANKHFPGKGFEWEMKKRSIIDFNMVSGVIANTMVFMDHPHVVKKATPFILMDSMGWNPHYYATLYVPRNFTDKNDWVETKQIFFYKLMKDVKGDRIEVHSPDPDIQIQGIKNGSTVFLLLNNLSNYPHNLNIRIPEPISKIIRRVGRNKDFTPYYFEEESGDLSSFEIQGRESIVLVMNYQNLDTEKVVNVVPYYGDTTRVQVEDDSQVLVQVTDLDQIEYAELRVGISRAGGLNRKVIINFNGVELNVPYEDSAIRLDNGEDYATCKIIRLPADQILAENRVNVSFPDGKGGAIGSVVLRVVSTHKPLKPAVTTFGHQANENGMTTLLGKIQSDGNGTIEEYGFYIRETINGNDTILVTEDFSENRIFSITLDKKGSFYYQAFSKNEKGETRGSLKSVDAKAVPIIPLEGTIQTGEGWLISNWFGDFRYYENGWAFHTSLGWLYIPSNQKNGNWLWKENYGWLWTKEGVWPYLWQHNKSEWFYLISGKGSNPLLYQHSTKTWEKLK